MKPLNMIFVLLTVLLMALAGCAEDAADETTTTVH